MAEASWPDPADGNVVSEWQYEVLSRRFTEDGVDGPFYDSAPVAAGAGLKVAVQPGWYACVRGFLWESGEAETLVDVAANGGGAVRWDWAVLRLDRSDWTVRARIRQGTAGAAPPALVTDPGPTGVYEIPLALVRVNPGTVTLTAADVTPYPLHIGSRVRPSTSGQGRPPNPRLGEITFDAPSGQWLGWSGSGWRPVAPEPAESQASIALATKWPASSGLNRVLKIGRVVEATINVVRASDSFAGADPNGSPIGTIPSGYRPPVGRWWAVHITPNNYGRLRIEPDGGIWLDNPTARVDVGRVLRATLTYLI